MQFSSRNRVDGVHDHVRVNGLRIRVRGDNALAAPKHLFRARLRVLLHHERVGMIGSIGREFEMIILSLAVVRIFPEPRRRLPELLGVVLVLKGDILITKVGTTGIPVLVDTDKEFSLFVSVALLKFNYALINTEYLLYLLKSSLVQLQAAENTRGVGNKNWVLSDIEKTLVVIPPLSEQKRIVAKINEIFAML